MGRSAVADAPGSLHGFPASLTSFVGRAQATAEIAAQLAEYRLVTLTGPGGAGKTRLAGQVARRVAGRFADGVWLAELAGVRDPAQVPATVAAALGVHDLPAVAAADALAHALAGCCSAPMTCGYWPPAGNRCASPGKHGTGWGR
ncbi:MAG TPA: hypothetical protein VGL33_21465 [Streptosporangiaceae bacterium]